MLHCVLPLLNTTTSNTVLVNESVGSVINYSISGLSLPLVGKGVQCHCLVGQGLRWALFCKGRAQARKPD